MLTLTPIAAVVVAFVIAAGLTPTVRRLALRIGAIDRIAPDKLHRRDVPRLGGLAIAIAFCVPLVVLSLRVNEYAGAIYEQPARIAALFVGALLMLALGVFDDLKGAWAWQKLSIQIPAAAIAWLGGIRIDGTLGAHRFVEFPALVSLVTTVGFIVVVVNAFNLLDGLDGLASGIALEILAAGAILAWQRGEPVLALVCLTLSGAVGGFLVHNFAPASIYMGDTGSMFIGYVLAATAVWSSQKGATVVGAILPVVALGLPLVDTLLAVFRRVGARRSILRGDLDHVHHKLLQRGWSTQGAVLLLYAVGAVFATLSIAVGSIDNKWLGRGLIVLAVALAVVVAAVLRKAPAARRSAVE